MDIKDVTPKNVRNFLEGNANYFLGSPQHVKEQAELRASLCAPCLSNGSCKKCGCRTPHMFYAPNKVDSAYRWASMLNENDWKEYKLTDQYKNLIENLRYLRDSSMNTPKKQFNEFSTQELEELFNTYFVYSEFDSPDLPGSAIKYMDNDFIRRLAYARHVAGIPFVITSGYRTPEYNNKLASKGYKVSKNSAHLRGFAADIACDTSDKRFLILFALIFSGFRRIGIGDTFIHVDIDPDKPQDLI